MVTQRGPLAHPSSPHLQVAGLAFESGSLALTTVHSEKPSYPQELKVWWVTRATAQRHEEVVSARHSGPSMQERQLSHPDLGPQTCGRQR